MEWTIWLRAVNSSGPGAASRTMVTTEAVPAVPAVWLGIGAVLLVLARRRAGPQSATLRALTAAWESGRSLMRRTCYGADSQEEDGDLGL